MTDPVASASPEGPELHMWPVPPPGQRTGWACSCGAAEIGGSFTMHALDALRADLALSHAREAAARFQVLDSAQELVTDLARERDERIALAAAAARETAILDCCKETCNLCRDDKPLDKSGHHVVPDQSCIDGDRHYLHFCRARRLRSLLSAPTPTGQTTNG